MFVEEVTERSARLVAGAQALSAGTMTPQEAGDLLREGHTIKGTGRVMGYEDVGSAAVLGTERIADRQRPSCPTHLDECAYVPVVASTYHPPGGGKRTKPGSYEY
jgi:hypothetical protein